MLLKPLIINKKVNGLGCEDGRRTLRTEDQFSYFTRASGGHDALPYSLVWFDLPYRVGM
jgi:hypothetical protein